METTTATTLMGQCETMTRGESTRSGASVLRRCRRDATVTISRVVDHRQGAYVSSTRYCDKHAPVPA